VVKGQVDLLLDATGGWILIDHKANPRGGDAWEEVARQYSGQLKLHKDAIELATGRPVAEVWLYFRGRLRRGCDLSDSTGLKGLGGTRWQFRLIGRDPQRNAGCPPTDSFSDAMNLVYILVDFENVQPTAVDMSLIRGADYRVQLFHGPHQNKFDADMVRALQPLGTHLEYVQCERRGKNALDFHVAFYLGRLVQQRDSEAAPHEQTRFVVVSKDTGFDALLGHVRKLGYGAARAESIRDALAAHTTTDTAGAVEPRPSPVQSITVTATGPSVAVPAGPACAAKPEAKVVAMRASAEAPPSPTQVTTAKPAATAKRGAEQTALKKAASSQKAIAKSDPWSRVIANLRNHPKNRPNTRDALERHLSTLLGNKATPEEVQALVARLEREGLVKETGGKIEYLSGGALGTH
jgi:hypothetical protein